jgi:hypothetical protein
VLTLAVEVAVVDMLEKQLPQLQEHNIYLLLVMAAQALQELLWVAQAQVQDFQLVPTFYY